MSRPAWIASVPIRTHLIFAASILLQVQFLKSLESASSENPLSLILAAAMIAPFVILALSLRPHAGLLFVPLLVVIPGWLMGFALFEFVLLACLFLILLRSLSSGATPAAPSRLEWAYAIYVVWAAGTLAQSTDMHMALIGLRIIVMLFLAFLAGSCCLGPARARTLVRAVAFLAVVISLQLLFVILRNGYSLSFLLSRYGSLTDLGWGTSNYIAGVAALSTACGIPLAFYGKPWEKALGVANLGAAVFVSLATISRGGTLAILVGILAAALLEGRRRFFIAVGILALLSTAYLLSPLGQASISRFIDPRDLPSVGERFLYYQETVRIIKGHWFWGVGPNQIPEHSAFYIGANPHNFVLKFAADLGFPGAALYLIMLAIAVRAAFRLLHATKNRDARVLGLAFVLTLVIGCTNGLYEPTLEASVYGTVFWVTIGTLYAVSLALSRERS
jgi:O-antigen ligase